MYHYGKRTKVRAICILKAGQVESDRGNMKTWHPCFFHFPSRPGGFPRISSTSLSIFIFTHIRTHILIRALASGVGFSIALSPFLNLRQGFFHPFIIVLLFCLFLTPHSKFLLSDWGDRNGLHYVCSFPPSLPLVSSCLTWLIRIGGGRVDGGAELLLACIAFAICDWEGCSGRIGRCICFFVFCR